MCDEKSRVGVWLAVGHVLCRDKKFYERSDIMILPPVYPHWELRYTWYRFLCVRWIRYFFPLKITSVEKRKALSLTCVYIVYLIFYANWLAYVANYKLYEVN